MKMKKLEKGISGLARHLVTTISEVTVLLEYIEVEQEIFIEFGCYLYRASVAILELLEGQTSLTTELENLQSISKSVHLAKDILERYREGIFSSKEQELRSIILQLNEIAGDIGQCLSKISSSIFWKEAYVDVAVKSLCLEMQNSPCRKGCVQESLVEKLDMDVLPSEELSKEDINLNEKDLYPLDTELYMEHSQSINMGKSRSLTELPEVAQYLEPSFEAFICPLTRKIMDDPVTIETGVTCEKTAIFKWFRKFGATDDVFCPVTGRKLSNRDLNTNFALKSTIAEWKKRNDDSRLKLARAALSIAGSDSMVFEALEDLKSLCHDYKFNKLRVCSTEMLPLLVKFLGHEDRNIKCASVELLQQLATNSDEIKKIIAEIIDISEIIKMLSSNHQRSKHASLLLLYELSKTQHLCEKIGSVTGGILILIMIRYGLSVDAFASEKADKILKNLELYPRNIKHMADNGFLEPLLNNLTEGSDEMKIEMASYLGEISLGHDSKMQVAKRASAALVKLLQCGNPLGRGAAFQALKKISSHESNSKILVKAGILQVVVQEICCSQMYNESVNSKVEAASILANIYESGIQVGNHLVSVQGHSLTSNYVLHSFICLLRNSSPDELIINLIRVLLFLTRVPKSLATIIDVVKQTEACTALVELINSSNDVLVVSTLKLLIMLSPYIGNVLAGKLCKISGQPDNLIQDSEETAKVTERQALSAKFLAKLPHENITVNQNLLFSNKIPVILQEINRIKESVVGSSRHASDYMEGLVGIAVRFTATLYVPQMLNQAKEYNFTSFFTNLLDSTSSDEVQRLAAIGLEKLSSESTNLSRPPQIKQTTSMRWLSKKFHSSKIRTSICPVHRGACSSQNTFCLIDAQAVQRLVKCLDHENVEVAESALSAISTLLDDKVDVEKSINLLLEANVLHHVLNLIKVHEEGKLQHKSFWMIERFLSRGGGVKSMNDVSQDKLLSAILVNSFHRGDGNVRRVAKKILSHLNKMPESSIVCHTI